MADLIGSNETWGGVRAKLNDVADTAMIVRPAGGLAVSVAPFCAGAFAAPGGDLVLIPNGVWFIGVDLFSRAVIALPRLGHTGWVPVAKVVTNGVEVVSVAQIAPRLPKSRLPRTTKKLLAGQPINVLVMGSSLAEGVNTNQWAGMLFNASSSVSKYRLPGTITFNNYALGGTPNQYQLAQVGLASAYAAVNYNESGYPLTITGKAPPNGRSTMFTGVDLVVITTLANGGDYRLECIEPIIRQLRKMDIEVILTTDNPQGATQVGGVGPYIWPGGYQAITTAGLYVDGPEVARIADLYGVELADTAAYVVDAALRYPGSEIYRDSIHMYAALPNGRTGQPSGGYEVYARAIRSCIQVDSQNFGTVLQSYNFDDGTTQEWGSYGAVGSVVSNDANRLKVVKASGATGQWGAQGAHQNAGKMPPLKSGDTVRVQGTLVSKTAGVVSSFGLQGGGAGWGSNQVAVNVGDFDITLTAIRDIAANNGYVLFFLQPDNAADGAEAIVDNISITFNSTYEGLTTNLIPGREFEAQKVPPPRVVTDLKTPGGAFLILPKDERYYSQVHASRGTLGAHPGGAGSFARRFSSAVAANEDLLTLTTGQRACLSALGVVSQAIIYYSVNGDPAVTFDLVQGNVVQKSVNIAPQTISREIYLPLYTPTQMNNASPAPNNATVDIVVTSGTLRIAALVALTFDLDLLPPEAASRIGSWSPKGGGGAPGMPGYGTDTANDYAVVKCPETSRRVAWLLSSKPNSKPVDTWSGRTKATDNTAGVNHIRVKGNHVGPGEFHYIKLNENQPNADQAANGYGLHFGGIVLVNDR